MNNSQPIVFIGIITFNSELHIINCLSMVRKQTYPNIQLLVLDNNSSDASSRLVHRYIHKNNFIQSHINVGYGTGHNTIMRSADIQKKDYYMPLNPDVLLEPMYISNLIIELKKNRADWGSGTLYSMNSYQRERKIIYSAGHALFSNGYVTNIGNGMFDDKKTFGSEEVFGVPGAAPLYSARLINTIAYKEGLFDKRMFMYYEDVDVDWRARLNGFRCWHASSAIGYHVGSKPQGRINTQAIANRYLSVMKNSFIRDLLTHNFIIIFFHSVFKLCTAPSEGIWLTRQLIMNLPYAIKRRTVVKVSRSYITKWFLLNKHKPTLQPRTILQRLLYYFTHQQSYI